MPSFHDGPSSPLFAPLSYRADATPTDLAGAADDAPAAISPEMAAALEHAPSGQCTAWGIPFEIGDVLLVSDQAVSLDRPDVRPSAVGSIRCIPAGTSDRRHLAGTIALPPTLAQWLVFMHTSDLCPPKPGPDGVISPMRGEGRLAEHAADYVMCYEDGTEVRVPIRRRHQLSAFRRRWGENCLEAVAHHKPYPVRASHEQLATGWGRTQTRVASADGAPWANWLWAWQNPHPDKRLVGIRFEPVCGTIIVSAISAGDASSLPLRWRTRRKVLLTLPEGEAFQPDLDERGLLSHIQLDLGQVISATPRPVYPRETWAETSNNQVPAQSEREILVEYTAHPDARFHLSTGPENTPNGPPGCPHPLHPYRHSVHGRTTNVRGRTANVRLIPVSELEEAAEELPGRSGFHLRPVVAATQRVTLRAVEQGSGKRVPVKLHVHGEWGEYLAPIDRHRIPNPAWFEDYSVDFVHRSQYEPGRPHNCTYIPGETRIKLPLGKVYVEVSKGFEIRPVRKVVEVTPATREITLEIEKVLPWRERGWVTADTHVHFLSPMAALLEGCAEGVNVVNLLASQWGELMTNVGDFDGKTTWGSKGAGGDGEYMVRVGTENRQHVLGHISLLGYQGPIIAPMTTGGPDESALGDPIEVLLTEWARQCKKQGGLVVLPHFPNPRAEHAASIVSGDIDAIEMTSWGNLYGGIDPYSISDWYRYLNCGYMVAAVGGTDKMSADTAVGTVRTYAHIYPDTPFTYATWMDAVRRAETFVTYGPLLEFTVDGHPMGERIEMTANGGTVDVTWEVASVTTSMSRVELVVNGEIRESVAVAPEQGTGHWSVRVDESSWLALLVRGHCPGRQEDSPSEIVAAHSSPVTISVEGSPMLAAADAVTILEQIEGALAYLDTVGTRAEDAAYKRMRLILTSAHRSLHNRMHQLGYYHDHTPLTDHPEHHEA